jgi:uncharacterized DUF497 family protein
VEFEWDGDKDRINRARRGFGLGLAMLLFNGSERIELDTRFDYGEERSVATGVIQGRVFVCVFTDRGDVRRIISLRRANRRENDAYYQGL